MISLPLREAKPTVGGYCIRMATPRSTMPRLATSELPLILQALAVKYSNRAQGNSGFTYSFETVF